MIKVELTEQELAAVVGLMDAGTKAIGLQALRREVLTVIEKFQAAANQAAANTPDKEAS